MTAPGNPDPVELHALVSTRILYFLYFSAFGVFVTYIDIYFRSLGYTGTQIGWINSLLAFVAIGAGPAWGLLSDRHGSARPFLAAAVLGTAALAFVTSKVVSFTLILPVLAVFAFFRQPLLPLLDSTTFKLLKNEPEQYGRQRAWGTVGFIITTWGFGFLLTRIGLEWMFTGYIFLLLLMLFLIPGLPGVQVRPANPVWPVLLQAIRRKEWLLFSLSIILLGIANWSSQHFLGIHIKDLGADERTVGTVAAVAALAELPVLFLGASLIGRFGLRHLLTTAYAVTALRLLLYGLMPSPAWAIPIALLHSVTFGVYWVAGVAYAQKLAPPDLKATSQGLLYAVMGIAGVLAGPLGGMIFDRYGANQLFIISALVALAAGMILRLGMPLDPLIPARS